LASWRSLIFLAIATIGILAAWSNSFGPGSDRPASVNWALDNRYIIAGDPRVRATHVFDVPGRTGWLSIWTREYWWPTAPSGLYRPIVTSSYWLNWWATDSDEKPKPGDDSAERRRLALFHAVNLLAHLIVTILVYRVVLLVTGRWWPSGAAGLFFALHPITTESVTNLVGRADEFAAISVLGGLLLYARATRAGGFPKILWLVALALLTTFGLFSKESAISVIGVVLLYDLLLRRWEGEPPGEPEPSMRPARQEPRPPTRCIPILGYLALLPGMVLLLVARWRLFAGNPPPPTAFVDNPIVGASWLGGRITALHVLARMWELFAWPIRLSCDYSFNQIPVALSRWATPSENAAAIASALLVLAVFIAAIVAAIRAPRLRPIAFFVLFFFITSFVTSNLVFPIGAIMAERFAYLPLVGFVGCLALLLDWLLARRGIVGLWIGSCLVLAVVMLYGVRTYQRNVDWRSEVTLGKALVETASRNFRGYQSYSYALFEELHKPETQRQPETKNVTIDDCIAICQRGEPIVAPLPDELNFSRIRFQLGMFYGMKGDSLCIAGNVTPEAREWFERAVAELEAARRCDQAVNALNRRHAIASGRAASEIADVGNAAVYENLGYAHARLGQLDEALASYEYQRHLDPNKPEVYERIAQVHFRANRPADAAVALMQELFVDGSRQPRIAPVLERAIAAANVDANALARRALLSLTRIFLESRQMEQAEQARKIGVKNRGIPVEEFDSIYRELGQAAPAAP
jgi:tetratricopeptide (TPR) repeat protein